MRCTISFTAMTVRIDSRFASSNETADVLGMSRERLKQLTKLIDKNIKARGVNGVSWAAPSAHRMAQKVGSAQSPRRKSVNHARKLSRESITTHPSRKSKVPRRTKKRGKKSKTSR